MATAHSGGQAWEAAATGETAEAVIAREVALDWLEPQGLNIVDLVGQVPESALAGMVISATPGYGILRYRSGQRVGDTVTITATVYPRFAVDGTWNGSSLGCLGQPARIDQLGSTSPASTVRLFRGAQDVMREAFRYRYVPAGHIKPVRNPVESEHQNLYRYDKTPLLQSAFTQDGQLILPANMGCEIIIPHQDYRELTAVFTLYSPQVVRISLLGSQDFTFYSYLGPGYAGHLTSLVNKLRAAGYGNRHETLPMRIPPDANYFLLNLEPSPADPFTAFPDNPRTNVDRPMTGTYRFAIGPGLSVDHVNSMGLPLYGHWQDADQSAGQYLTYARQATHFAVPEYFLPPGIPYDPCMSDGGCPRDLLDRIYNTPTTMRAYYLRVERTSPTLQRYGTQMVGPAWRATTTAFTEPGIVSMLPSAASGDPTGTLSATPPALTWRIRLPIIIILPISVPPNDPTGCSPLGGCGWFTADGRMVDYIPLP
ncbi:MAG: PASTA domain-containing protein [Anaerolineae bacterium]|nr:PASTA domain-containing protein [Anaerolineae bacterium]